MISFEDIKRYLPQYLSSTAQQKLFQDLRQFPDNIDKRIYTSQLSRCENIFQGDGIQKLLCINLPCRKIGEASCMILSNTCDIDPANKRLNTSRMVYTPIFNLDKYEQNLIKFHVKTEKKQIGSIKAHISDIKKQYISHIFYLPKGGGLKNDSIIFFDRLNNCLSDSIEGQEVSDRRIFTLSDYGFYLFLFKLSVHFTRIRENLSRSI